MTSTYRTHGKLTNPVNDLAAARDYLRSDDMTEYVKHADHGEILAEVVHHIEWDLPGEQEWEVRIITTRDLDAEELKALSSWISGQNSDGLGEGFEQQDFADCSRSEGSRWDDYDEDEDPEYASFDWQTNPVRIEKVK